MSSLLQIRGVPEEARRGLKARAAARGQSLNSYLLDIIDREVSRPTVAEFSTGPLSAPNGPRSLLPTWSRLPGPNEMIS